MGVEGGSATVVGSGEGRGRWGKSMISKSGEKVWGGRESMGRAREGVGERGGAGRGHVRNLKTCCTPVCLCFMLGYGGKQGHPHLMVQSRLLTSQRCPDDTMLSIMQNILLISYF